MKKVILFSLMLVSFVGYSQEFKIIDRNSGSEDGEIVIDRKHINEKDLDNVKDENDPNFIYSSVEKMPEYSKGGDKGFKEFISKNYTLKTEKDLKGFVIVQFVVEKNGSLSCIKVLRDLGYGTGAEAIRVLKLSEKWKAGLQNGKKVRVLYTFPVPVDVKANLE